MKKIVIFLISAILMFISANLSAQTEKNQTDGCNFRFVLVSLPGVGWPDTDGIEVIVDGVNYGFLNLPWGTPSTEETLLLPSGEVNFSWMGGVLLGAMQYFEIYNALNELIYTSPDMLTPGVFFTYHNECSECLPLTDFEGEYNQKTKVVNLSWVAPESEYVTGFDIFRNGEWIDHVAPSVNSYTSQTDTLENGDYKYCVIPIYPYICDLEEKCFETYINNVGIKNYSLDLLLYPNPAQNELRVTSYELLITNVEIFDVFGRKQKSRKAEKQNAGREMVIDISNLANGIYFVEITTEKGVITKKVIKQ